MAQQDAVKQLQERFEKPLDEFETRRVVFWHDVDGSFEQQFDALAEEGIARSGPSAFSSLPPTTASAPNASSIACTEKTIIWCTPASLRISRQRRSREIGSPTLNSRPSIFRPTSPRCLQASWR